MNERRSTTRKAKPVKKPPAPRKPRTPRSRKPVNTVVVGMHHSGTSALAGMLGILGCDLPKTLVPADKSGDEGSQESQPINDLLERLLTSAGSSWDDWLPMLDTWFDSGRADDFHAQAVELLQEEYGTSRLFLLKNPRMCRLMPFWDRVWESAGVEPRFAMIHRNPLEVAAAMQQRNGIDPQLGMFIWLRHVLDGERGTRGRPRSFTSYSELMQNWQHVADKLQSDLKISLPRFSLGVTPEVEDFLSPALHHFNETPPASLNTPAVSAWVRDVHDILERWVDQGEDKKDHARLDEIHTAFDTAAPAFARIVQQMRKGSQGAGQDNLTGKPPEEVSRLQAALAQTQEAATRAETEVEAQQQALQTLRDELSQTQSALHQRAHEADETAKNLQQVKRQLSEYEDRNKQLEKDAEAQNARLTELLREISAVRQESETEQQQRFEELANLTRRLVDQENASSARQAELEGQLGALQTQIGERDAALHAQAETSERLSGKVSEALNAILDGASVVKSFFPRLADKRKAKLLEALGLFDRKWYAEVNKDVREAGADPALHFVRHGYSEGRAASAEMLETQRKDAPK